MIHIRNKAKEMISVWKKEGFGGVRLHPELGGSDEPEEGEQTIEEKAEWDRNYVNFVVQADLTYEDFAPIRSNDYVSLSIGVEQFWEDFQKHLQETFGPDVDISFRIGCHEFEIQRKGS